MTLPPLESAIATSATGSSADGGGSCVDLVSCDSCLATSNKCMWCVDSAGTACVGREQDDTKCSKTIRDSTQCASIEGILGGGGAGESSNNVVTGAGVLLSLPLPLPQIIAVAAGGCVCIFVLLCAIVLVVRRKNKKSSTNKHLISVRQPELYSTVDDASRSKGSTEYGEIQLSAPQQYSSVPQHYSTPDILSTNYSPMMMQK